jgi:hypothetical protein
MSGLVTVIPNWLTNIIQFEISVGKHIIRKKEPLSSSPKTAPVILAGREPSPCMNVTISLIRPNVCGWDTTPKFIPKGIPDYPVWN